MSYILDALRKADAQRERDPARGIHAQPVLPEAAARKGVPRRVFAIGAGVLLVAVAGFLVAKRPPSSPAQPEPQVQRSGAADVASPVMPPLGPAKELQPPAPPALPKPAPAPVQAAPRAPAPAVAKTAPFAAMAAAPASLAASSPPVKPASAALPAAMPASAPVVAARIMNANEVPDLPKLAISGGVYSDNPAQRMLISSGQVVNEGAELAPGVTLEQIRAKSAVVRFRGLRVAIPY
jgi:general secretion pathway protein B